MKPLFFTQEDLSFMLDVMNDWCGNDEERLKRATDFTHAVCSLQRKQEFIAALKVQWEKR